MYKINKLSRRLSAERRDKATSCFTQLAAQRPVVRQNLPSSDRSRLSASRRSSSRSGAVIVLVVILLPVALLLSAFAINVAYMELNRTELYTATDAAARAGGREFTFTRDQAAAKARAREIAALNDIAGTPLSLADGDFVFGKSTRSNTASRYSFSANGATQNALQVTSRRNSGSPDGPIPLLMPSLLGRSTFESQQTAVASQLELDIALVIDRSGSMAYSVDETAQYPPKPYSAPDGWDFCDPAPPDCRWRNVLTAIDVFLNEAALSPAREQISLTTYNDTAITNQELTLNYALVRNALVPYTNSFCEGGTNIGGGIFQGIDSLVYSPTARQHAVKVVVVLTDGIHNIGADPVWAANEAAAKGSIVFTVTFSAEAQKATMKQAAEKGGGKHFHAANAADLVTAFQEIFRSLPTLLTQ